MNTIKHLLYATALLLSGVIHGQDLGQLGTQQPVRLSSGFAIQTSIYSVSKIPYRRQPFNWSITGTPVLEIYGFSMPFSFYVSNQQLGYQQPFNQFGISPTYKWATAHLGYSSVKFSDYTLAGRRFLGAGVELNPGKLRLGFVYGRFQKAVEQDSVVQATPEGYLSGVPNGAFARKGYAAKLGFGTDKNYVDFIYLHAADDTNSLEHALSFETLKPERNSAFGLKHKFSSKSGLFWESDASISYYTRDANAEAVDTGDVPSFLYRIFDPKITGQLLYAATTRAGYDGKAVRASIRYRRISRDFKTMGAYYFQTDLEEYALLLATGLWKRRVQLRGNLGIQNNNLSNDRLHTTKRGIASLYTGIQVTRQLRTDILFSNFGITQRPQQPGLSDSIRIDQVLKSWQFNINYQIPSARPQTISLQFNTQDLAPREMEYTRVNEMRSINSTAVYAISIPDSKLNISLVGQLLRNKLEMGTIKSTGGGITVHKGFGPAGKINSQAGIRFFSTSFEENNSGTTITFDAGLNIKITDFWTASGNIRFTTSDGSGQHPGTAFHESLITLGSQFHF